MIIDTHLHLIYRNRLAYPWLARIELLDRDAHYDDYSRTARQVGITAALHMEVDVADTDRDKETQLIQSLMQEPESLIRGAIASCRPESRQFAPWLDTQLQYSHIKGFRRVLHVMPDLLSTTALFRNNVKRLSGTGRTFDLCVLPRQMQHAIALADHCPEVTFVLDHCGVPDIKSGDFDSWHGQISELARRTNVLAKISGIVAYTDTQRWTVGDLRPYVEHTIAAFGWDRVVWGSDSPVCTLAGQVETWVAATHALLSDCSASERASLLHENARRLWKL